MKLYVWKRCSAHNYETCVFIALASTFEEAEAKILNERNDVTFSGSNFRFYGTDIITDCSDGKDIRIPVEIYSDPCAFGIFHDG